MPRTTKPFTQEDFLELIDRPAAPSVSIYLATRRAGKETLQNPIRFKNLIRRVEERIRNDRILERAEAEELLGPARALIDDTPFWQHQSEGLAFFLAPGFLRRHRVPISFRELATVNDHFHVKPLLRLVACDGRFYVLSLDRKNVRLFESTRFATEEVDLGETPTSFLEVVGHEVEPQHLQWHTRTGSPNAPGARPAVFHGYGEGEDDVEPEIRKFLARVDEGIRRILGASETPLLLAGPDPLPALFRSATSYPHLVERDLRVHTTDMKPDELRDRAWELVEPVLTREQRDAARRFHDRNGTGLASGNLEEILPATIDGRVDTLFVARGRYRWGTWDEGRRRIGYREDPAEGARDLLDYAAAQTILKSGRVWVVDPEQVPAPGSPIAAVFRY